MLISDTISKNKLNSPCIRHCCLDPQDICLGCFRHLNEITGWTTATEQQQQEILVRCGQRRLQAKKAKMY